MRFSFFAIIIAALWFVSCENNTPQNNKKTEPAPKKKVAVPVFNGDSAYFYTFSQVNFGPRVSGTEAHRHCKNWLVSKLEASADTVYQQNFKARTYDKVTRRGVNIIASFNPEKQKRILLMAHWDSRPFADADADESLHRTPIDAANDGASGVGVLLEIARQFGIQRPEVGVDIVLFDLEDWGPPIDLNIQGQEHWGLGSQYWSRNPHHYGYSAAYGILLDMVGAEGAIFKKEYYSKYYAAHILDKVWETAQDMGLSDYFLDEDGGGATDDHYFVNTIAKIPSIDIIHMEPNNNSSFFEHWHTSQDNMEHISKESLAVVGQVVLQVVYHE